MKTTFEQMRWEASEVALAVLRQKIMDMCEVKPSSKDVGTWEARMKPLRAEAVYWGGVRYSVLSGKPGKFKKLFLRDDLG